MNGKKNEETTRKGWENLEEREGCQEEEEKIEGTGGKEISCNRRRTERTRGVNSMAREIRSIGGGGEEERVIGGKPF